jgi:hypothetical protein
VTFRLAVAMAVVLGGTTELRAAGDHEMLAAEQELKVARDHLQAAGPDYAGHRRAAMDAVDRALHEIHEGIQLSREGREAPGHRKQKPAPAEPGSETDDD